MNKKELSLLEQAAKILAANGFANVSYYTKGVVQKYKDGDIKLEAETFNNLSLKEDFMSGLFTDGYEYSYTYVPGQKTDTLSIASRQKGGGDDEWVHLKEYHYYESKEQIEEDIELLVNVAIKEDYEYSF